MGGGGAAGARASGLRCGAVAGQGAGQAWVVGRIICVWTPPHFGALASDRTEDVRKAGLPMLPVTHGSKYTRFHILLYTVALVGTTLLPFALRMSGWPYLVAALLLGAQFLRLAWSIWRASSETEATRLAPLTFRYSLGHLSLPSPALLALGVRYSFPPLAGVLFTFPSRYWFTIGQ